MAYKKFDDPNTKVNPSNKNVYQAFLKEEMRRALQGITNRVSLGGAGTDGANVGEGSTGGFACTNVSVLVINGLKATASAAQDNLKMTAGTMASNSVCKFLICSTGGTAATVIGPANIVSKADYSTVALANAAAKLPDLPDGYCALGYALFNTPTASAVVLNSCGLLSTAGTVAFYDLITMPYNG
jgi:hypothetical protein